MTSDNAVGAPMDQSVMNRWLVVVGAILIQLALGALYAWSVFTKKLELPGGGYEFTNTQTAWVFSAGLFFFAVAMLFAGKWQAKSGPRLVAVVGALVLGAGYVLAGFFGSTYLPQFLFIGLVGGLGIGLAYVVPIAVCVKWFPDKKGLITGLAVAGFGFGATIWVKLAGEWFGGLLNILDGKLFGLPGVQAVFVVYGIAFTVMVLLGSIVMVNPPAGWKPAGWNPPPADSVAARATGSVDLKIGDMVSTPQYWALTLMFFGSALAGLMVIYCIRLFGIDSLLAHQQDAAMAGVTAALEQQGKSLQTPDLNIPEVFTTWAGGIAGWAMAVLAIFNGLGRIVWGAISDKMGRRATLILMCALQGVMMLVFFKVGTTEAGLIIGAGIIGFNFGGNFALFPAATADLFGNKRVGTNYPIVFIAYGIAGIAGPIVAGRFKDLAKATMAEVTATMPAQDYLQTVTTSAWKTPFIIAGVACLVAAVLALTLRPVKHSQAQG